MAASFPARGLAGGEVTVGEKLEGARAHLPVVSVGAEVACGGLSAGAGGGTASRRRRSGDHGQGWLGLGGPVEVEEAR